LGIDPTKMIKGHSSFFLSFFSSFLIWLLCIYCL